MKKKTKKLVSTNEHTYDFQEKILVKYLVNEIVSQVVDNELNRKSPTGQSKVAEGLSLLQ